MLGHMMDNHTAPHPHHLIYLFAMLAAMAAGAVAQPEQWLITALEAAKPEQPLEVAAGVQVDQVTAVDQKAENFGVVANLRIEWTDPALAFDAREFGRDFKLYNRADFARFAAENAILVPDFVIYNQQGRRFIQDQSFTVFANGHAAYLERFTTTLQAPDFDFVQYPFDSQRFFIHIESTWPSGYVHFLPMQEYSGLGKQLGEEEWVFNQTRTKISTIKGVTGKPSSRFTLGFIGHRHLNYYILRIFIPLGIIILVSWVTFFLHDFGKRVDVGGGNLLVLVAFNFTISDNLPQLGYMTFLDAILVVTFVLTGLVVVVNVMYRRLEVSGRETLARQIDKYTIWVYPASLGMLVLLCWHLYESFPASG